MSTFMANAQTIERKWYILDAAGKPMGRTAAKAAAILRGKKETQYKTLMATKPELAMRLAVKGMMPKNSVGRWSLDRLKVYAGSEHKHQAQKPVALDAE